MLNQFQTLDQFLLDNQDYWRFEPFFLSQQGCFPWLDHHPLLCDWLASLTQSQIEEYKQDTSSLLDVLTRFLPQLQCISLWTQLPLSRKQTLDLPRGLDNGIPGRKLEQIYSMGEALLDDHHGQQWLEWCSGKGFLGRILASQTGQRVTSFEFQPNLCQSGQSEADKLGLAMQFVQGDAFSEQASEVFHPHQHAVALHACGDLHVALVQQAVQHQLSAISFSPCCYHLINDEHYRPLSKQARQSSLSLTKQELRIPLQETVTGGERVKRHRVDEMSYRLGLDILLREILGQTDYQPMPSIKKSQLSEGFEAFCLWASEQKGFALPPVDFHDYHQRGIERFWHMERLSLVQQPFRRVLELWLALDKVLYLQDVGYRVSLSEFCLREATPRNILIHAVKD
ncbi:methyltransferase [Vibrio sinaloensis]|uniref:methyltransferase n=1 Tax=Photobacterium sp. (strain ATCC 43367) TaxID=379097 RepID=UPI002066CA22|nr:methyltransferase [Vibrio sinaloensis]UPQ88787.1 SAM-dependent methyltransferase [Vibrio sinaloensis]